jgi:hypothetical protein
MSAHVPIPTVTPTFTNQAETSGKDRLRSRPFTRVNKAAQLHQELFEGKKQCRLFGGGEIAPVAGRPGPSGRHLRQLYLLQSSGALPAGDRPSWVNLKSRDPSAQARTSDLLSFKKICTGKRIDGCRSRLGHGYARQCFWRRQTSTPYVSAHRAVTDNLYLHRPVIAVFPYREPIRECDCHHWQPAQSESVIRCMRHLGPQVVLRRGANAATGHVFPPALDSQADIERQAPTISHVECRR